MLVIPAAGTASAGAPVARQAAPGQVAPGQAVDAAAASFDALCRSHSRNYVLKHYYRGPGKYNLRCGTSSWGWKHIKARHGWNATMDRKISAAFWSGRPNGRGGFSTYTAACPSVEKFRTILGTPAGPYELLTAYKVNSLAAAAKC
ncbi:hypothetical protein [Streptomyces sp. NPDC048442]|uniref:hypothetical protein n=1 Tax=Streptomyces sp. NPDC048442 TaxID=3154823 RepID=UPI0034156346